MDVLSNEQCVTCRQLQLLPFKRTVQSNISKKLRIQNDDDVVAVVCKIRSAQPKQSDDEVWAVKNRVGLYRSNDESERGDC